MKSILYVRLPCKPIYPAGVVQLAWYVHRHRPETEQRILDLALIKKRERKKILAETIKKLSPDIIAFSWRDIQIFSPNENDDGLLTAFRFWYGNIKERILSVLKGLSYLLDYKQSIRENLFYINWVTSSYPGKRIVLGGGAVSIFASELLPLLEPGILCVIGEGEEALLKMISGQTNEEISASERVIYKDKDGLIHKGENWSALRLEDDEGIDFDYITSIFPDFSKYLKADIGITTKRGCPHQCIFCAYNYIEGKEVRYRPAKAVLKEIESLYLNFGVRDFYFTDSQFIPNREALGQVEAILSGIISKGLSINWQAYLRIEAIDQILAKKMVGSGLSTLELSIGSGCQRVVDGLKLGLRLDDVLDKARLIKDAGFRGRVILNYCLNAPYETKESLRESIKFYHQMVEIFSKDRVYPFIFFLGIQPHTELASLAIKQGFLRKRKGFLSLSPFMVKGLIYNPPPLDALMAKSFLKAKREGEGNTGVLMLEEIERRLDVRDRTYTLGSAYIQGFFTRIAKDYDRSNSVITLGLHHYWRRRAIKEIEPLKGRYILDLCTGTGDMAILATKAGGKVVGVDFCKEMLAIGREKISKAGLSSNLELKICSIPPLPFDDETFDCLTCGFGLRYLPINRETFAEILRVLKPNGKMSILEVGRPKQRIFKAVHHLYFYHLVPYLGKIFAKDSKPYRYLGESTNLYLPPKEELLNLMVKAGFVHLKAIDLTFGAATIYRGEKQGPFNAIYS